MQSSLRSTDRNSFSRRAVRAEAAQALGMTPATTMRVVLLPQALRIIVPPLGNEFNLMMKSTSVLSVIGLQEMFLTAQSINSATFKTFEIFLVVACYYLALTTVWSFVQRFIERRLVGPGPIIETPHCGSGSPAAGCAAPPSARTPRSRARRATDMESITQHDGTSAVMSARGVVKRFGAVRVLNGISMDVRSREVVMVGPSGSGKTTFLRCLNHLERIDEGEILVHGGPVGYRPHGSGSARPVEERPAVVAERRRDIGFVFQRFNLFLHLTALDNVAVAPAKVLGVPRSEAREQARTLLARVGLEHKASFRPSALSGGQQLGVPPGP